MPTFTETIKTGRNVSRSEKMKFIDSTLLTPYLLSLLSVRLHPIERLIFLRRKELSTISLSSEVASRIIVNKIYAKKMKKGWIELASLTV